MIYLRKNFRRKYISYDEMKEIEIKYRHQESSHFPVPPEWIREHNRMHYDSAMSRALETQKEIDSSNYLFSYKTKDSPDVVDYFENENHLIQVVVGTSTKPYPLMYFGIYNIIKEKIN